MTTYKISGGDPTRTAITLPANSTASTTQQTTTTGEGTAMYGELTQANMLLLLESFTSQTEPPNPTVGTLWLDAANQKVKYFSIDRVWTEITAGLTVATVAPSVTEGKLWYNPNFRVLYLKVSPIGPYKDSPRYVDGTWVQLWPQPINFTSLATYNAIALKVNKVVGLPFTDADGQWGWGETDTLPILSDVNTPTQYDNRLWLRLISRLMKACRHAGVSTASVSQYGFIFDGKGDADVTATSYTPSIAWAKNWGGASIETLVTRLTALEQAADALVAARHNAMAVHSGTYH